MIDTETDAGAPTRGAPSFRGRRGLIPTASAVVLSSILVLGAATTGSAQEPAANVQSASEGAGNPCMQCHADVVSQAGTWNGRRFSHAPHLERANLACSFCHTPLENHGGMKLDGVAACNECHHDRSSGASCSRCHSGGAGAPRGVIAHETGPFDHELHGDAGLPCTSCHAGSTMSAAGVECMACHTAHHRPEAGCLACHEPGTMPEHPDQVHFAGCAGCHGENGAWIDRWTRETCTVCHTEQTDHYPPRPCEVCHLVPEIPASGDE
ncbi:MAG: hypothetical protein M8835_02640 [marine benthic group bacterium]|nr:hypothetical protein [Gemmatimonadota bacterium]